MKQTRDFLKMKETNEPITMITAYDYPSARQVQEADIDMILVGDSLGMVVLGYDSTIPVTVEDMIHHTKAVKRGAPDVFTVTDMPFMSYHGTISETMQSARLIMQQGGAQAVKLEGAGDVIHTIARLTEAGVPVVAHLGLTPQSVGVLGGYRVQGKDAESARKLIDDAKKVEKAGAIALVLECVPQQLAATIQEQLTIPIIGIGAGNKVDGQVLVYHDLLGYGSVHVPKFVKQYTSINETMVSSIQQYVNEVKSRSFPEDKHSFNMKESELLNLYGGNS
ncbi:3-methyl-2-oxobutanoate hydroxymethyltransferase [Bacillus solimangrovi]|uniref:3-methyl-2-oxobutanoate hydroxymethyltransferase n=1 Tax=Bacillus solimangrovi TaxID=1305675 RepID=A0A1E5LH68_9BACI|nr:3-methyl-2-oxobutanoate hydroxymethyltransferase [Bacillus solimangrovi]OEH93424.1 3-methyl-2-oxobutanoate hydroxymethyltransferase [Bacillus solimangrovi]